MQQLKEHINVLQEAGFRLTKARRAILAILDGAVHPLSVFEVLLALAKKKIAVDKTTVYREITFLKERRIVQQIQFGDRVKRYELRLGHHHHLVCVECDAIADVSLGGDLDSLEQRISRKTGFRIDDHSLEFFGLCVNCK